MKPLKYLISLLILLLFICGIDAKKENSSFLYFADFETDQLNSKVLGYASRSFETKVYTLDMLYKNPNTRTAFNNLSIIYSIKGKPNTLDYDSKNKYNLIVDIGKDKNVILEITNDNAYMQYFRNVKKDDVLNYFHRLNKYNTYNIPRFVKEASEYFNNPEFYKAYAEYLAEATSGENSQQVINCYLLGGDFLSAASLIEKDNAFSDVQKIFVFSKARRYDKALSLYLSTKTNSNAGLARICNLIYKDDMLDRSLKSAALSVLPDANSNSLLSYYSDQREYIKGYLFTQLRFPTDIVLLTTWKEKAVSYCNTVLSEVTDDDFQLLLLTGMNVEAYNVLVAKGKYLEAIDIVEANPGYSFADTTSVYNQAAEQLLKKESLSYSFDRLAFLYEKGENWNKAGYYAEKSGDKNRAIRDYEKSSDKQYDVISQLYGEIKNYEQAAYYKILADSTAYGDIAYLYEQGKMFDRAAAYYYQAKNYSKSAECGELSNSKDYKLLALVYYKIGNISKVIVCLDYLYKENPMLAEGYYKSTGNLDIYRKKLINAGKYKEALDTYDPDILYSEAATDTLIDLSQKAGNRSLKKIYTKQKLELLAGKLPDLYIADLNKAISLANNIGDLSKEQLFKNQKNNQIAQYQKAKRGTYVGVQPSYYMRKGDPLQILIPEVTYEFTIFDKNQISIKVTAAAHYFTDFYGKTRYRPEDTYRGTTLYKVIKDENEKYVISFKNKDILGDNLCTLTLNLKFASGMFSDNNPDPDTGPDVVVYK